MATQILVSGLKNQVAVTDGFVSNPSISFSGDVNTGLYRPGSDTIGVVTGGVERMRVDSGGNVGIGIGAGTPLTRLEIKGNTSYASMTTNPIGAGAVVTTSNGNQRLYLGAYYTGGVGSASAIQSSDFFNSIDNAGPLILNPLGGNVGIGSANPSQLLSLGANGAGFPAPPGAAPMYACRAWVCVRPSGGSFVTIADSRNVSSVTRNGTGDYTIAFTSAMASANYAVAISQSRNDIGTNNIWDTSVTASSLRIQFFSTGAATYDPGFIYTVAVFQ